MSESRNVWTRGAALGVGAALALFAAPSAAGSLKRTLDVQPGGSLRVELTLGSVEIESHDEPTVEIDADGAGFGIEFDLRRSGDDITLTGTLESFWNLFRGGGQVRVRARVPREFDVRVETRGGRVGIEEVEGEVDGRTTGGSIDVDRISGPVYLHTTGGSIDATEVRGDLRAETTGGSIRIEEVHGNVEARTTGGGIRVEDVRGRVEAHTTGGSLRVSFDEAPAGVLRTTGGSIEVEVPEGAGVELHAQASGGGVSIDDDLGFSGAYEGERVEGDLAGGGAALDLRTSGGRIRVRRR